MNIILQDIYQLFKQHEDKQPLSFPLISSYRVWLNNINSLNCRKDKTLLFKQWRSIAKKSKASPCDFNFKKPLVKNLRIMTEILLDEYSLNKLLTCHYDKKYSFNIESIVLGIFLLSSFNVHKLSSMSLNIVNSGREMDMPFDIEISQLIGNTLAIVPMFFSIKNFSNAFNQKNVLIEFIQSVHAELLSANENPYDFGYLMMQANSEEKKVLSKINQLKTIFVYLGKMRDNYHGMEDLFSLADQPFSTEREADAPLDFYLNVFNALYQKKLILSFVYSEKNYKYETLLKYVEECKKILNLLLND